MNFLSLKSAAALLLCFSAFPVLCRFLTAFQGCLSHFELLNTERLFNESPLVVKPKLDGERYPDMGMSQFRGY